MQIQPLYNAVIEPFFTLTVRRETFFFHGQRMILYCTVHRTNQGRQVRFRPTDSAATLLPQQLPHGGHLVLERLVLIRSVCIVVSKKKKKKEKEGRTEIKQGSRGKGFRAQTSTRRGCPSGCARCPARAGWCAPARSPGGPCPRVLLQADRSVSCCIPIYICMYVYMGKGGGLTQRGAGRVHDVLEAGLLDEALHVGDLGGDGGGCCSHL